MNKNVNYLFALLMFPVICIADCTLEANSCSPPLLGFLEQQSKAESNDDYSHLTPNGVEIYKARTSLITFL